MTDDETLWIWLDPNAPNTNFLLGLALAGGDWRAAAAAMAKRDALLEAAARIEEEGER